MARYTALFQDSRNGSAASGGGSNSRLFRLICGGALGLLLLLGVGSYSMQRSSSASSSYSWSLTTQQESGNPFALPGYLSFDPDDVHATNWIPFDERRTPPAPDWPALLREAAGLPHPDPLHRLSDAAFVSRKDSLQRAALKRIPHLMDTSILLIGDSVDRNAVIQFSELLGIRDDVRAGHYTDIADSDTRDWDIRGLPHIVHLPSPVGLTVANCFVYGVDDHDEFGKQVDWHAPGKTEDRLEQLCKPLTEQLDHPPSLLQLHSGLWDCSLFGRMDRRSPDEKVRNADTPLTQEQMEWWMTRMRSIIRKVQQTWPDTPIVYRKLHRPTDPGAGFAWTSGQEHLGFTNWFVDVRIAQIREMQEQVAREAGLYVFDFGHVFEGFQAYQDSVHPRTFPGGAIMSRALLHFAYMASEAKGARASAAGEPKAVSVLPA